MNDELTVKTEKDGNTLIIQAKGEINTNTAPEFEDAAKANLEGVEKVILDFTEVDYISSAGLRVMTMIYKETGSDRHGLIVRNPNTAIMETLRITGFIERITIEKK